MANYVKILIRRDSAENWEKSNPVLALGEIACDMTRNRLKVGDGIRAWSSLSWSGPEVLNDLVSGGAEKALSAEQGKVLKQALDGKADADAVNELMEEVTFLQQTVEGLKQTITNINVSGGIFGMGYTVDSYNGYGKPTHVTFSDGLTATLTWSGTRLEKINASNGQVMTMTYNADGRITGRTVTQAS